MFELRRYESPGEAAARRKIEMFNGEPSLKVVGSLCIFGETLLAKCVRTHLYAHFDDMAKHDKN